MKRRLLILSGLLFFTALAVAAILADAGAGRVHRMAACHKVEITITDSLERNFVTRNDVGAILDREYGLIMGKRLDSLNLSRMERILDGRSAILKSQCYTTDDGILHVSITQRDPIVAFNGRGGLFFADETGFIFPAPAGYRSAARLVEGPVPIDYGAGYKGEPAGIREKEWLAGVTALVRKVDGDRIWKGGISSIRSDEKGNISLKPSQGRETFLLGQPFRLKGKFAGMEEYYRYIAPARAEEGLMPYRMVDVSIPRKIICK